MKELHPNRRPAGLLVRFPEPRRRAPRRSRAGGAVSGSLALTPLEAPRQKPLSFPTPSRWFSERNGAIGFRLFDIVYLFALARQAMEAEDALEWGSRYFSGALSEAHGRTVLELLSPGMGEVPEPSRLAAAIREGFQAAIGQAAGRLLQRPHLDAASVTAAEAHRLQELLERLYEQNGWLLPAVPYTLHRLLRYSRQFDYE